VVSRRDPAAWLLATAVRLLPPERARWGAAMRAELAGIDPGPQRWRFALGCLRVIVTRPAVWRHAGYPLLMLAALAATAHWTSHVEYAPLRWGLVGLVASLVVVAGLGRVRVLLPVAGSRAARSMRAFGYLLVGVLAAEAVAFTAHQNSRSVGGVPVFTVMFAGHLFGFLALTAQRAAATSRTLLTGALAGCAAAAGWTGVVMAFPPIPPDVGLAVLLAALAIGAAVLVARRRGDVRAGLAAGACAGMVAALLILHVVLVLSVTGPAWLIPDLVPAALSPADDVANSRVEIQDPYMWMLLIAWLIALGQSIASLTIRRPDTDNVESWMARVGAVTTTDSHRSGR
jgi:hypothetical protein